MYKTIIKLFILAITLTVLTSLSSAQCVPQYECGAWGACEDGIQSQTCVDKTCGKRDLINRGFCGKPGCSPEIECGAWGECTYTEKTDSLIQGKVSFGGYRSRVCYDASGCVEDFIQEGSCEEVYQLALTEVNECGTDFLTVLDPSSDRQIAKINLDSWKSNRLDLSFVQGTSEYCPSCYNAKQDSNEEAIDCGGDCKPCKIEQKSLLIFTIASLWFLSAVFIFFSVRELTIMKKEQSIFIEGPKTK